MFERFIFRLFKVRQPTFENIAHERLANRTLFLQEISPIGTEEYKIYHVAENFNPDLSSSQDELPVCYIAIVKSFDYESGVGAILTNSDRESSKAMRAQIDSIAAKHKNKMPDQWELSPDKTRLGRSYAFDR